MTVTLTRVGVRQMDGDNLAHALKPVRDAVAALLGVDDAHPMVRWRCRQDAGWCPMVVVRVAVRTLAEAHRRPA